MVERLHSNVAAVVHGLRSSRGLLAVAVLTLAIAIGVNVAIDGLVDRALLSPARHLKDPASVFTVAFEIDGPGGAPFRMTTTSYPTFRTLRDEVDLGTVAAWTRGPSSVVIDGEQVTADTMLVSDGYFRLTGVHPHLGAGFASNGSANGVVISHAFWLSAFGGDPDILNRRVSLNGIDFQIAGVMPRAFSGHAPVSVDAWFPIEQVLTTAGLDNPFQRIVSIVARVAPAEGPAAAARGTAVVNRKLVLLPVTGSDVNSDERQIAYWLAGVSAMVLLIGLANATTLLTVRAAKHRRESAIRAALGATRGQLLAHVVIESTFLALCAAAVSLALGYWLDEIVRRVLLPGIVEHEGLEVRTIAGAALAGVVAAVLATAAGASQVASAGFRNLGTCVDLSSYVARGFSSARFVRRRSGIQRVLLVFQTTLSVALLAGAGMFARSLHMLLSQDFGMRVRDVLIVDFEEGPGITRAGNDVFMSALERIGALPGVAAAAPYEALPFTGFHVPPISIPDRPRPNVEGQLPFLIAATPDLFGILGIQIVEGRAIRAEDDRGAPVVVVNETMAREVWPGERAVGKCIRIGFPPGFDPSAGMEPQTSNAVPCREVVGVARDTRQRSIVPTGIETRLMQYYVPLSQVPRPPAAAGDTGPRVRGLVVRTSEAPDSLITPIRRLLVSGRTDLPPARVRPYAALFERQVRPWRMGSTLLALFSTLAVSIAAVGLYASFTHAVTLRRREIAIRLAIGATATAVRTMVLRDVAVLTASGICVGLAGALVAGRSLQSLLFGIAPADPFVLAATAILMLGIAIVATALPARMAARTDPNALLRAE